MLISFILVGGWTLSFNYQQFDEKLNQNISEKLQSVVVELEQKLSNEKVLNTDWKSANYQNLNQFMLNISQIFFTDINLYDLNGNVLASSRPEIFEKGLIGFKMNSLAYKQMVIDQKAKFIHQETIGDLQYTSAYLPFYNADRQLLAYINLPYFIKPKLINQEISTVLITFINLYVVLFLISITIAIVFSNTITKPLRLLQSKFEKIELGKKSEPIDYTANDEIGGLVKEYNKKVIELENSVSKLAQSEREMAWREMAKQIAHEIKNPLTPMKLSMQFLVRSWKNKDENFDARIHRVSNTIIDQIDSLTKISNTFYSFAKMPKGQDEEVDLIEKIENSIQLFSNTDNVTINKDFGGITSLHIIADREQTSRIFINIIKNASQAIPNDRKGKIDIVLITKKSSVIVKIQDNGSGISEEQKKQLFIPSFTTKSSGMGMGLPIVKNIIEGSGGKIWFETELNIGTKFFIEFPIKS